jgi:hypothetical protein
MLGCGSIYGLKEKDESWATLAVEISAPKKDRSEKFDVADQDDEDDGNENEDAGEYDRENGKTHLASGALCGCAFLFLSYAGASGYLFCYFRFHTSNCNAAVHDGNRQLPMSLKARTELEQFPFAEQCG